MKRIFKQLTSCLAAVAVMAATVLAPGSAVSDTVSRAAENISRVSVHDPSIALDKDGTTYYVFGSHIEAASSTDLVNWKRFSNGYITPNNKIFGDLSKNLAKSFAWAGENDVDSKGGFSVWAPDVFWNPAYVNTDGSKGAYMMYFCTTSTYCRSVISYAVSQNIEGPYEFVDTLIYSGFTRESAKDNGSQIDKKYTNTNIDELIADGTLKGVCDEWFSNNTTYNTSYAPNAIDPTVFEDKDYATNGKLWLTYGSWSGGIFVLEVDPATGKVKYPGGESRKADTAEGSKDTRIVDPYFGTRIAGGYTVSGEGPYILYDEESDYYYLYVSYEGLAQKQGYNMRLFRSKNPDGPYVDAKGNNAALSGKVNHNDVGVKVMGNYRMEPYVKTAYMAPGHNSALIDPKDGQRYLFYHTRFSSNSWVHELRVHQQFLNEDGWPVTAVYENNNDKIAVCAKNDIIGEYSFVNHGIQSDGANVNATKTIVLTADGKVTGDVSGTWSSKDAEDKTYLTITYDKATYKGVFFNQTAEGSSDKVMTFTAIGDNNMTIFGSKAPLNASFDNDTIYAGGNTGSTTQIKLSGVAEKKYTVTHKSSKTSVATVNSAGKVTARKSGETVITTTITVDGKSESFKNYVYVEKASIEITDEKTSIKKGKSFTFKAEGTGIKNSSITWTSSKPSVIKITKKGKAKAKKAGTAKITAKYKNIKATVKVKVKK